MANRETNNFKQALNGKYIRMALIKMLLEAAK